MANAWKYFEHFKYLDRVDAITFSHNELDVEKKMIECWDKKELLNCHKIDKDRAWYLFEDGKGYRNRLLSCVDGILD